MHIGNQKVEGLLDEIDQMPDLKARLVFAPRGVIALYPPTDEAPQQVVDVTARSPIEIFLSGLISVGSWRSYLGYSVAAGIAAWIGVYTNSLILLVAAILIAPFGGPAMKVALGTARGDGYLLSRALARYVVGLAAAVATSLVLSLIFQQANITSQMQAISTITSVAFLQPLLTGAAGALNLVQSQNSSLVPGTAAGALVAVQYMLVLLMWWLPTPGEGTGFGTSAAVSAGMLVLAGLVGLWSAARLILRRYGRRGGPAWPYAATGVFFMVFFYGSFIFLFVKNPAQLYRLGQLLQYFRLVIDASLLLLLAWGLRRWIQDGRVSGKWYLLAGLLVLWLVPIFWTPGNVYRGALPEKPRVIAHRGASALAPENTLASMRVAAELGVYGLETDIAVSIDGVLVLLHDANLARTTDVAKHFSGREN